MTLRLVVVRCGKRAAGEFSAFVFPTSWRRLRRDPRNERGQRPGMWRPLRNNNT